MNDLLGSKEGGGGRTLLIAGLALGALALVVIGLTVANYRFAVANPGGNDFIPRWLGTRLLMQQGQNPYSDETSLAIQTIVYGRAAKPGEDQVLFVYPLYSSIVFAPFALIGEYAMARAVWMTTLEIALLALAFISFRLAEWRPSPLVLALTLLFALIWYHGARPLINGNPSILMALFVAAALLVIKSERDIPGGILLAMATIKPQAVVLILPLILIWAVVKKRFVLLASAVGALGSLALLAALVEPSWLWQNLEQVSTYPEYTLAGTPGAIFQEWWPSAGPWPGIATTIVIVAIVVWQWRYAFVGEFTVLLPVVFLTMAATNLVGITTAVSNYVALFPGLILVLAFLGRDEGLMREKPAIMILLILLIGLWLLFWVSRSGRAQGPIMFFPLPLLLITSLPFVTRAARYRDTPNSPNELLST